MYRNEKEILLATLLMKKILNVNRRDYDHELSKALVDALIVS